MTLEDAQPATSDDAPAPRPPDPFVPLRFVEVAMVLPAPNPIVVLEELDGSHRRLHIPVGLAEGTAIAHAAFRTMTPRPLTHELFINALGAFGITCEVVRITAVHQASFSAELIFSSPSGSRTLSCRLSDALALALRQEVPAPITAAPGVLDQAGVAADSGA